jgi:acetyl-CoA carboxylase alpha subunit
MAKLPGTRIQIHLAKMGTRHPETFQEAVRVMASRPGFSVTGLVLTNKDGAAVVVNAGATAEMYPAKK